MFDNIKVTYELKGHPHKICCVDGFNQNVQNLELTRVSDMPAELPSDASCMSQRTFAMKRFIRQEWTERLGFGRNCEYEDL
jgi:hypothetical protein